MKFRKKPVVIEAQQFHTDNGPLDPPFTNVVEFCEGEYRIRTLEGSMTVSDGDWIIRGVKGEFYCCKPDIFEATYDPVDGDTPEQQIFQAGFRRGLAEGR